MVGDGKTAYDTSTDGKSNEVGSCVQDFTNRDWPTKARVKYVKGGYLQLSLNIRNTEEWEDCFLVPNVVLPESGYLGFTSHTGDVYGKAHHMHLISWLNFI